MSEHKRKVEANETKAAKPENEVEQLSGYHPADALSKIVGAPPSTIKPAQILVLQRTVGNKVVQRMIGERKQQSGPYTQANISPTGDLIQRHPEDTAQINNLKDATNSNFDIFYKGVTGNRDNINNLKDATNSNFDIFYKGVTGNRDKISSLTDATNDNFELFYNSLTGHKDLIDQHGARLSNLESRGAGGEEVVVPATAGI